MDLEGFKKGRVFGHPIHLMLVHFPSSLIPFALILDLVGIFSEDPTWFAASVACLSGGVIFGVVAACFGFMDYLRLPAGDAITFTASRHALMQVGVLTIIGVVAGVRWVQTPFSAPSIWIFVTEGFAILLLVIGNYQGGELVLRYGVGSHNSKDNKADRGGGVKE